MVEQDCRFCFQDLFSQGDCYMWWHLGCKYKDIMERVFSRKDIDLNGERFIKGFWNYSFPDSVVEIILNHPSINLVSNWNLFLYEATYNSNHCLLRHILQRPYVDLCENECLYFTVAHTHNDFESMEIIMDRLEKDSCGQPLQQRIIKFLVSKPFFNIEDKCDFMLELSDRDPPLFRMVIDYFIREQIPVCDGKKCIFFRQYKYILCNKSSINLVRSLCKCGYVSARFPE